MAVTRQLPINYILGCGSTPNGELGFGGTDESIVPIPKIISGLERQQVRSVAAGRSHSLFLMSNGEVYSCGSNDQGQLGQTLSARKPASATPLEHISSLSTHSIVQIAAGQEFSMVLSEAGQVFVWGSNSHGQLGNGTLESNPVPKLVKQIASQTVVQIACGAAHCIAVTNGGTLFSWGRNSSGQIGVGEVGEPVKQPVEIDALAGLPISQICCGGDHCLILSKSGTMFVWGSNRYGQLGLADTKDRAFPTLVKHLRHQHIKYVAAGDDHTAALTAEGGLFTFGCGNYGQLGHGSKTNQETPRRVMELMGSVVTQVSCGRCHTVAYAPKSGKVFAFGIGGAGQLGNGATASSILPTAVLGKWVSVEVSPVPLKRDISKLSVGSEEGKVDQCLIEDCRPHADPGKDNKPKSQEDLSKENKRTGVPMEVEVAIDLKEKCLLVYALFAGGDRTFLICHEPKVSGFNRPQDYRVRPPRSEILSLDIDLLESIPFLKKDEPVPQDIMNYLEIVLSSPACMNGSFLREGDEHYNCAAYNHGLDMDLAMRGFKCLEDAKNVALQEFITNQVGELLKAVLRKALRPVDIECLRVFCLIPLCHLFQRVPEHLEAVTNAYSRSLLKLQQRSSEIVAAWFGTFNEHIFGDFVRTYKKLIDHVFIHANNDTLSLELSLKCLKILNGVNREKHITALEEFYVEVLAQHISIEKDYTQWTMTPPEARGRHLFFCDYPFVFDAAAKTTILMVDSAIQKHTAVHNSMQNNLNPFAMIFDQPQIHPYLVITVNRNDLINDTLEQLRSNDQTDLRKPLKVIFKGEEAVDEGGVRKEFFMLLIRDILDPKYGMFTVYDDSQMMWFNKSHFRDDMQTYFLIGVLCGLAIYNQTIIPLPFPLALYRKLLREKVGLTDLKILSPSMAKGLEDLLAHQEDDMEDVFCLNFTVTRDNYGQVEALDLKPGGSTIGVNQKNKQEYVDLYVDHVLNKSCKETFNMFAMGFYRVLKEDILKLFNAQELMTLVAGKENYDWKDLELHTGYKDEYNPTHPTVRMFWKVFHSLTNDEKKKFLLFLTGTDRIPILGMGDIKMSIAPMRAGDTYLPVAHTCFNLLDLPMYSSPQILRKRLTQAIQHTQGFGLA